MAESGFYAGVSSRIQELMALRSIVYELANDRTLREAEKRAALAKINTEIKELLHVLDIVEE